MVSWNTEDRSDLIKKIILIFIIVNGLVWSYAVIVFQTQEIYPWILYSFGALSLAFTGYYSYKNFHRSNITEFALFAGITLIFFVGKSFNILILMGFDQFLTYQELAYSLYGALWVWFNSLFLKGWLKKINIGIGIPLIILEFYNWYTEMTIGTRSVTRLILMVWVAIFWLVAVTSISIVYPSKRTIRGRKIMQFAAIFIIISGVLGLIFMVLLENLYLFNISDVLTAIPAYLAFYIIVAFYPEGFILTEHQTLSAIRTFERTAKKERRCKVFCSVELNNYIKNIPGEVIDNLDNEGLKSTWEYLNEAQSS